MGAGGERAKIERRGKRRVTGKERLGRRRGREYIFFLFLL